MPQRSSKVSSFDLLAAGVTEVKRVPELTGIDSCSTNFDFVWGVVWDVGFDGWDGLFGIRAPLVIASEMQRQDFTENGLQ